MKTGRGFRDWTAEDAQARARASSSTTSPQPTGASRREQRGPHRALTGPIATKADNPNLPTTPEEIAEAARGALRGGRGGRPRPRARRAGPADRRPRDRQAHRRPDRGGVPGARSALDRRRSRRAVRGARAARRGAAADGVAEPLLDELRRAASSATRPTACGGSRRACRSSASSRSSRSTTRATSRSALQLARRACVAEPLQFSIVMGVRGGMPATPGRSSTARRPASCRRGLAGDRDRPREPRR